MYALYALGIHVPGVLLCSIAVAKEEGSGCWKYSDTIPACPH